MMWEARPDLSPRFGGDFGWFSLDVEARRLAEWEDAYRRMDAESRAKARGEMERAREVVWEMAKHGEYV